MGRRPQRRHPRPVPAQRLRLARRVRRRWDADLDHNGVPDIDDPEIHASTAGRYLCDRLDGVRRLRAAHPDWAVFQQRSDLDALVIAHNAGEAWLPRYPTLPDVTEAFLRNVAQRVADWSEPSRRDAVARDGGRRRHRWLSATGRSGRDRRAAVHRGCRRR